MHITIDESNSNQRFDRFLRKYTKSYPTVWLSDIFRRIRKGEVRVNSKKASEEYRLTIGDQIEIPDELLGKQDKRALLSVKDKKIKKLTRKEIQTFILFEDDNWVIFNKPAGIVAHEGNNHRKDLSMNDYLEVYAKEYKTATFKPSFGYRLDKDTSGVLIGAKTYEALQFLNQIIRERNIEKTYFTVVTGQTPKHLIINKKLEKTLNTKFNRAQMKVSPHGQESITEIDTLKTIYDNIVGQISFLRVKLHTGRMHQIRVHLSSEGHPVLGDLIYGNPAINRKMQSWYGISRQLLHCRNYKFTDFTGKTINIIAPLPKEFTKLKYSPAPNF